LRATDGLPAGGLRVAPDFYNKRNITVNANGQEVAFDLRKGPPSGYTALLPPPEVLDNVQNVAGFTLAQAAARGTTGVTAGNGQVGNLGLTASQEADLVNLLKILTTGSPSPTRSTSRDVADSPIGVGLGPGLIAGSRPLGRTQRMKLHDQVFSDRVHDKGDFSMKRTKVLMIVLGVTALSLGVIRVGMGRNQQDELSREAWIGLRIAPVRLNLEGKNPELVGLGSYTVNAQGGCNDCHNNGTQYLAGGDPFLGQPKKINMAGYLIGGNVVFGVTAPDIVPELGTTPPLPAGRTFPQFVEEMRHGIDPDDGHILQVMPWPDFQDMTEQDLRAIYEYLSALPPIQPPA
jgi:hypothetical protein